MPKKRSKPEAELELQLRAMLPTHGWCYQEQYPWNPHRQFAADVAIWPCPEDARMGNLPLLVEIDGAKKGAPGAHQRVDGIDYDCRRQADALVLGYRVLRVSSRMVRDGTALQYIEQLMGVVPGRT